MDSSWEDQNPLKTSLAKELDDSLWLRQFRDLSQLLQSLKREVPLTQQCKTEWVSEHRTLRILCPDLGMQQALSQQASTIVDLNQQANDLAKQISLIYGQHEVQCIHPEP